MYAVWRCTMYGILRCRSYSPKHVCYFEYGQTPDFPQTVVCPEYRDMSLRADL